MGPIQARGQLNSLKYIHVSPNIRRYTIRLSQLVKKRQLRFMNRLENHRLHFWIGELIRNIDANGVSKNTVVHHNNEPVRQEGDEVCDLNQKVKLMFRSSAIARHTHEKSCSPPLLPN